MPKRFSLHWHAGSSASLELFSPPAGTPDPVYQVKYTPAFRATIRPPVEPCNLGPTELAPVNKQLEHLVNSLANIPRAGEPDRKSTRLNSSHSAKSRMPSSA